MDPVLPSGDAFELRPDLLVVGDELRYLGNWYTVMGVQHGATITALRLFGEGRWLTVFYRHGWTAIAVPAGHREQAA